MVTTTANPGLFDPGTMGSALALNILDRGLALHVANRSPDRTAVFLTEAAVKGLALRVTAHDGLVAMARGAWRPLPRDHADGSGRSELVPRKSDSDVS